MVFIDGSLVNVALPVIQRELAASVTTMQWIVEAYALMLAALVLIGGALGDRYGRRRVFGIGTSIFSLASALCGLAPTPQWLVIARGLQGVGGALLVPGSLALISAAYPERERGAAIGTWSAASSITSAGGPVLGGFLIAHASWRWLFWLNVPIGAMVALLSSRHIVESRDDDAASARMDWVGATLVVLGLGAVVFGLIEHSARQAASLAIGAGCALLVCFAWVEAKSHAPMVPLSLFRSPVFAGTNLLTLLLYAALGAVVFFLPFDLIQVQRYSPAAAGAALLPFVVVISLLSPASGAFAQRHGPRLPLTLGPLCTACGFVLLALAADDPHYASGMLPAMLLLGLGMGITVAPLTAAVMGAVDPRHAGLASGINNAVARAAGLLAIAALGLVVVARFEVVLDGELSGLHLPDGVRALTDAQRAKLAAPDLGALPDALRAPVQHAFERAFVSGFRALMWTSAGLALLSALAALFFVRSERPS